MSQDNIPQRFLDRIKIAKEQQLTELDLSNDLSATDDQKLTQIPDTVFELTHLQKLDLSDNQLTEIPKSISNLSNLTKLGLDDNQLMKIPESIGNLSNLTRLNLNYNQLTKIPESINNLSNLMRLNLNDNQLTKVFRWLATNKLRIDAQDRFTNNSISLFRNPITEPPLEVVKQGNQAILNYYDQKGSFGVGANTGEIATDQLGGTINESQSPK